MPRIISRQEADNLNFSAPEQESSSGPRILSKQEAHDAGIGVERPSNIIADVAKGLGRNVARVGTRAVESAVGAPFDIANLALSGANLAHKGVTGEWSPGIEKAQGYLPTAEFLRKNVTEPYLPESVNKPHNEYEELADNLVSDFVNIMTPVGALGLVGKGAKAAKAAAKTAGAVSGLGNAAGFLTKKVSGSQGLGDAVKVGTMLGVSLAGAPRMFNKASSMYDAVDKLVPEALEVSTKPLQDGIKRAEGLMKGHEATEGAKAMNDYFAKTLNTWNSTPNASVKELIQADKGFNRVVQQNPGIWKDVFPAKKAISNALADTIKQSGNKDIWNMYSGAKELYSEAIQAARSQNWMDKVAGSISKSPLSLSAQVLLGIASPTKIPYIAATQGASAALKGMSSLVKRAPGFLKSPTVRRYYVNTLLSAANQNRPGFIKHAKQLDKALSDETFNQFWGE